MESLSKFIVVAIVVVALMTTANYVMRIKTKNKKIRDALFQLGLGYKRYNSDGVGQNPQELEYKNAGNKLLFKKFNYGFSTLDFYKKQQALEELFGTEFANFERVNQFEVIGQKADFKSPIVKEIKQRTDILIGFDGIKKHFFDENRSAFIFAPSGTGKTHFLKKCIISQLEKLDNQIHIITSKKSDFDKSYSYHNPNDLQDFKQILKTTEEQRLWWEEMGYKNKKYLVFIFDEVQEANDDKEITSVIKSWVRVGRSQNIWVILASQSGTVASLRNIEVNLIPIKIAVRYTESVAFAETIFTPELAFKTHHIKQPMGYGYIKTSSYTGGKVRFYYEP
ncbi:MAG: ATP-binding protein [Bdellovibrionaceae bacterium]|nr:ATP-binding protein [Pseudobdellovibrionaceae bacterium]